VAGQSITFDFLTTGADRTAAGFRKVGDNTVLAARGAKVLADAIEKLGSKEDRTAAESVLLAKALRQTGDAEDRVAARAVLADAAIRRMDDAMKDSTKSTGGLSKALGGLKLNPGLLGPVLALAPAIATLGGVAAGAAAGLGGAFIAGAGALAAFGAVAKPVLTDAKKAAGAVGKAQDAHAVAVAKVTSQYQYAMSVAKTKAQRDAAYAKEQKGFANADIAQAAAQGKAYAGLSAAQIALSKQLGAMADAWNKVKAAETPVIAGALQPWLKSVTDLTGNLAPIIAKISPVIASLGGQFDRLVNSPAFRGFRDFIGSTGSAAVSAGGSTIIDLVKAFMILLPKFDPLIREAVGWISRLGPAVLTWASSKKAADQIQSFLQWFSRNGPVVGGLIKNIGGVLAALAPGLTSGGALELKVISDFLGLVAKLPPSIAKPLAEVAGAALILSKMGVLKVGLQIVGAAAGWVKKLLGGTEVALGAAGMQRAGDTMAGAAAAMQRAADTMAGGAAAGGAEGAAGKAAGKTGALGKLPGLLPLGGLALGGAGIGAGFFLEIKRSFSKGWQTFVTSDLPKLFGGVGGILNMSASGWSNIILDRFSAPVRRMWGGLGHFMAGSWSQTMSFLHGSWSQTANFLSGSWAKLGPVFSGVLHTISTAWNATWGALRAGFRNFVVNGVLGPLGTIIHGAALAFGWVPGLGGKLQGASKAFDVFRDNVNKSLGGINGRTVNVSVAMTSKTNPYPGGISGRAAAGMYVSQGTGPTADDVLIRASRGELVVPAGMVKAGAVDHLRGRIPGFAGGGVVVSAHTPSAAAVESTLMGSVMTLATAFAKAAAQFTAGNVNYKPGAGVSQWRGAVSQALSMAGLSQGLALDVLYQMQTESGGNPTAVNRTDSNWVAGHPSVGLMQVIRGTYAAYGAPRVGFPAPVAYGVSEQPVANIYAAVNYAQHNRGFGTGAGQIGSGHGYAKGGLVPGYASGGTVGQQGRTFLNAWQTRHGGPYALAVGPKGLNQQIPEMAAALGRARTLAGAGGLSAGQRRFWAAAAASEARLLATLNKERATEQAWKYQLGLHELGLDREIRAAGNLPGLAGPVRGWKAQMAGDKATIAAIGRMLGGGAGAAAGHPAVKPGPVLPKITHTYGGDVANTLGTVLAAALGPFTGARAGALVMDSGGTLRPGFNPVWNMTGRPESLVPARGRGGRLQIEWVGGNGGDDLERWIRKNVKVRGGGDVQRAYGSR